MNSERRWRASWWLWLVVLAAGAMACSQQDFARQQRELDSGPGPNRGAFPGFGEFSDTSPIRDRDLKPTLTPTEAPDLALSEARHDFGTIAYAQSSTHFVYLHNSGTGTATNLHVQPFAADSPFSVVDPRPGRSDWNPNDSLHGPPGLLERARAAAETIRPVELRLPFACGAALAPGETCSIAVKFAPERLMPAFAPASEEYYRANLVVAHDSGELSSIVEAVATSRAIVSLSDGPVYDFGVIRRHEIVDHVFTLTSSGMQAPRELAASALAAPFSFKGGRFPGRGGTCGTRMAEGERTCTLVVSFDPAIAGTHEANLTLSYGDTGGAQTTTLKLMGGTTATPGLTTTATSPWHWSHPMPVEHDLVDVAGSGPDDVWVISADNSMLRWRDGEWSRFRGAATSVPHALYVAGPDDAFAVGPSGAITHWNGLLWSTMEVGTEADLSGVWGTSGRDVWAVGGAGTILHFDGAEWTRALSGTTAALTGVWGSSPEDVWAVGAGGAIVHFDGRKWTKAISGASQSLAAVWGSGPTDVWAVGGNGALLHWNGQAWQRGQEQGPTYLDVFGTAANDVWVSALYPAAEMRKPASAYLHYDGTAWTQVSLRREGYATRALWGASADQIWGVGMGGNVDRFDGTGWTSTRKAFGTVLDVSGTSARDIWAVGGRDIFTSGTGVMRWTGTGWTQALATSSTLRGVYASDSGTVWAVGNDLLGRSAVLRFDGKTWSDDFAGMWGRTRLNGVWGTSDTDVFVVGADERGKSVIHRWDGKFWSEYQTDTTLGAEAIWGSGSNDVYAVGGNGVAHWDGNTWTLYQGEEGLALHDVWGRGRGDVWAVGSDGVTLHWDGASLARFGTAAGNADLRFEPADLATAHKPPIRVALESLFNLGAARSNYELRSVSGLRGGDVFAVGYDTKEAEGMMLRWNGSSWTKIRGDLPNLFAVWGAPDGGVWLGGANASLITGH